MNNEIDNLLEDNIHLMTEIDNILDKNSNQINNANYSPLLEWLRSNIHQHGRRYTRNELLEKATGETLNPNPYIDYLKNKASQVYGVKF